MSGFPISPTPKLECPHRQSGSVYDNIRDKVYTTPDLCEINRKSCLELAQKDMLEAGFVPEVKGG